MPGDYRLNGPQPNDLRNKLKKFNLFEKYLLVTISVVSTQTNLFIYLFGVLRRFQHCTGHITMGSWKGRANQYTEFVRDLYCKLPTNGK